MNKQLENIKFYHYNKSLISKIRRSFFANSWDEFTTSPVISMLQYAVLTAIIIGIVSFNNIENRKIDTKNQLNECKKNILIAQSMANSMGVREMVLNTYLEKHPNKNTTTLNEHIKATQDYRTKLTERLKDIENHIEENISTCKNETSEITTNLMNNGRDFTLLLKEAKKAKVST